MNLSNPSAFYHFSIHLFNLYKPLIGLVTVGAAEDGKQKARGDFHDIYMICVSTVSASQYELNKFILWQNT